MERLVDVRITEDRCIGSATCEFLAPTVFEVDDVARVIATPVADHDTLRLAAQSCPAMAIVLTFGAEPDRTAALG